MRRTVLARRRPLAALAAAVAVAAGLQAAAEPPPPRSFVLTAAHDLAGGAVVAASDLTRVAFDPASVPSGTVVSAAEAVGRTTVAPMRAGEPITDVRLLGGSLLDGYPGKVAAPVRIADAGAVDLLKVGDVVDVLAAAPQGGSGAITGAAVVAADAPVVALPQQRESRSMAQPGGLVVVAIPDKTAQTIAAAGVSGYLSIVIKH